MNANILNEQFAKASEGLRPCGCGGEVEMRYEPGCTFIHCGREAKSKIALPDWQPAKLAEKWNQSQP